MRNKETTRIRAEWVPQAHGEVLEIGIGSGSSGLNLPFYPRVVRHVYGVDPSLERQRRARKRAAELPIKVDFLSQSAENLPAASRRECRHDRHNLDVVFHPQRFSG